MFEQAKNFAFPATSFMQSEGEQGTFGDFASGYLKQSFNSGLSLASAFSPVLGGLSGYLSLGISPSEASGAATFELGSFAASAFAGGGSSANAISKLRIPTPKQTVNLASAQRTKHILTGDATGGGHKVGFSTLFNGKTKFPASWSSGKIMNIVSDIATDPSLSWSQQTGRAGSWFTRAGKPSRFTVEGARNGANVKVVIEPAGEGIITAFPLR